jgi:nucleotidyltransferase substrate binding protein (TIGR01987 family)
MEPLENALQTLKEAWVEYQKDFSNTFIRDSVIQRFEYTFELSHKTLRRFLSETESSRTEVSTMFFNDLIRLASKRGLLLNNLETWDKYRRFRNLTSHNYDEFNADSVAVVIPIFLEDMEFEIKKIKECLNEKTILLHIEKRHLTVIWDILKNTPEFEGASAYFFGSRVQGKAVAYSDVDIAVDYQGKALPDALKTALVSAFEKSILPYHVDIIDLRTVSKEFRATIEKDFIKIV